MLGLGILTVEPAQLQSNTKKMMVNIFSFQVQKDRSSSYKSLTK